MIKNREKNNNRVSPFRYVFVYLSVPLSNTVRKRKKKTRLISNRCNCVRLYKMWGRPERCCVCVVAHPLRDARKRRSGVRGDSRGGLCALTQERNIAEGRVVGMWTGPRHHMLDSLLWQVSKMNNRQRSSCIGNPFGHHHHHHQLARDNNSIDLYSIRTTPKKHKRTQNKQQQQKTEHGGDTHKGD